MARTTTIVMVSLGWKELFCGLLKKMTTQSHLKVKGSIYGWQMQRLQIALTDTKCLWCENPSGSKCLMSFGAILMAAFPIALPDYQDKVKALVFPQIEKVNQVLSWWRYEECKSL